MPESPSFLPCVLLIQSKLCLYRGILLIHRVTILYLFKVLSLLLSTVFQISNGDYLGVFYPNATGDLNCGGYMEYQGNIGNLTAWGEDVGYDGFVAGQEFVWKIWDASANMEYVAYPTYDQSGAFPNTGQFAINGMSSLASLTANSVIVPWNYTFTSGNHTVLLDDSLVANINGAPLEIGDYVGVFFYDSTTLVCGGYSVWTGSTTSLSAWADDPQTSIKDGFSVGDEFVWKIWDASDDMEYFASAVYKSSPMPNQEFFEVNGMSGLDSLTVNLPWSVTITSTNHTILLPETGDFMINSTPVDYGDFIGVFYDSLGTLVCGGFAIWEGITSSVTAWGEDQGNDGFVTGDLFVWKIFDVSEGIEYFATPTYMMTSMPDQGIFAVNGMSGLESLSAQVSLVPWEFTISSTNHQILLPDFATYTIGGMPIEMGDYIGVFYDSVGTQVCAGYQVWQGISTSLAAWADESQTSEIEGFQTGDVFYWKIWDASEDTVYVAAATYMQPPTMPNTGTFVVNGMSGISILQSVEVQVPWDFTITATNHSILVPTTAQVFIDTNAIELGDYIGVFYDSLGTDACAGYGEWTGATTAITAWGEDQGNDGFVTDEVFKWKIWDASEDTVYEAFATYSTFMPNQEKFAVNGMSSIEILETLPPFYIHELPLFGGWGIYSTYVIPFEPNIDSVFADIVSNVEIVKDGLGAIYWPQFNLNMIGDINVFNGYQIKTTVADTLVIVGDLVIPEQTPMSLPSGWSIFSYLRTSPAPIVDLLSPIVSSIDIVKDGLGAIYWPGFGLDMIGNMIPGYGYQMKLTSSQILTYPANTNAPAKSFTVNSQPVYFGKAKNTGNNMSLAILESAWPIDFSPNYDAEVAVYAPTGVLVGSASLQQGLVVVSIWGNDDLTNEADGMLDNEAILIKYWDSEKGECNINVSEWEQGSEKYEKNAINVVANVVVDQEVIIGQNYPNPFAQTTEIDIFLPKAGDLMLSILDGTGRVVMEEKRVNLASGATTIRFSSEGLSSGAYFYRIENETFTVTRSMQVVR